MPDDGLLDFVVVPAVSRLTILTLIGKYAKGGAGISRGSFCAAAGRCTSPVSGPTGSIWTVKSWWILSSLSVCLTKKVNFFLSRRNPLDSGETGAKLENRREREKKEDLNRF
mgnify:CR=1 FL=1